MVKISRRGLMLVLSSPSGAGKTTLANLLLKIDKHIHPSVSVTTRKIRPGEIDGVHYYFVSREKFKDMIEKEEFLEWAEVYNEFYGTPRKYVEEMLNRGEDVLFDIDWQGNKSLTKLARNDVVSVFLFPPTKKDLLERLRSRAQDSEQIVQYRLAKANEDMSHWQDYDYSIINKDLDESLKKLLSILRAERLKKARRLGVPAFVKNLLEEKV